MAPAVLMGRYVLFNTVLNSSSWKLEQCFLRSVGMFRAPGGTAGLPSVMDIRAWFGPLVFSSKPADQSFVLARSLSNRVVKHWNRRPYDSVCRAVVRPYLGKDDIHLATLGSRTRRLRGFAAARVAHYRMRQSWGSIPVQPPIA